MLYYSTHLLIINDEKGVTFSTHHLFAVHLVSPVFRRRVSFWSLLLPLPSLLQLSQCAPSLSDHPVNLEDFLCHRELSRPSCTCLREQCFFSFFGGHGLQKVWQEASSVWWSVDIAGRQLLFMVTLREGRQADILLEKRKGMQEVQTNDLAQQCAGLCSDKTCHLRSVLRDWSLESIKAFTPTLLLLHIMSAPSLSTLCEIEISFHSTHNYCTVYSASTRWCGFLQGVNSITSALERLCCFLHQFK